MKTGDIINIFDGSWSLLYENGKLRTTYGVELGKKNPYEVIAVDCKLPTDNGMFKDVNPNSMIVRNIQEGFIVFTQPSLCSLKHRCSVCPHCGKELG